jgi:carbon monoxide dehydrogenase subunit G
LRVEERFSVSSSRELVYALLNDVGEIGLCVAGVQSIDVVDETHSRWRIEQRFGFIARTFTLEAQITERDPLCRVAFAAADREVSITGHVLLDEAPPAGTECSILLDIDVSGPLAPLVDIFARGPQQALIRQTVANLREKLEAAGEPVAAGGAG